MMLIFVSQFVIRKKKKKKKSCAEIGTTNKKNVTKNELHFYKKILQTVSYVSLILLTMFLNTPYKSVLCSDRKILEIFLLQYALEK